MSSPYRMLALGQYSNVQYGPAMNAFKEALSRDPDNPDLYYEMGLVARDGGSPDAAAKLLRIPIRTLFRKLRVAAESGEG